MEAAHYVDLVIFCGYVRDDGGMVSPYCSI